MKSTNNNSKVFLKMDDFYTNERKGKEKVNYNNPEFKRYRMLHEGRIQHLDEMYI